MGGAGGMVEGGQATGNGSNGGRKTWAVFTIVEGEERTTWRRIGSGHLNRDGSFNLYLEALPVNGKLHMRVSEGA